MPATCQPTANNNRETAMNSHDLVDIIDLQPVPGEYAGCRGPLDTFEVFGVQARGFHRYHAARSAVSQRWGGRCECCGHYLRYAHITQDSSGDYHCFGRTCLSLEGIGEEATRRLEYSERIEQKERGFCATFNVPPKFWDMPREQRPAFARVWKGKSFGRRASSVWKLSIWADCFEECLENCLQLSRLVGVKLS